MAIDNSPLAIKICRLRAVSPARVMSITQVSRRLGSFDTLLLLGHNFGLMSNARRARWLLRRLAGVTTQKARIIAETLDPYATSAPEHRLYLR